MKAYPIGYSTAGSQEHIDSLITKSKVLLIDTRKVPYSTWSKDWNKDALERKYGERYHWAGEFLGNINYKGGPIKLANPALGIKGLIMYLAEGYDLILLCQCRDYSKCHRSVIVDLLLGRMPEVEIVLPDIQKKSSEQLTMF